METKDILELTERLKKCETTDVDIRFHKRHWEISVEHDEKRAAAFTDLVEEIVKIPGFKELSIERGGLTPEEISKLFNSLAKSDNVKRLSIWNQISSESISNLSEYVKSSKNLKELFFDDNSKGEISIDDASLAELAKGIIQNHSLEWLWLSDVTGSKKFYTIISDILSKSETINNLSIHGCAHHDIGIANILEGLQNNTTLKQLSITSANLRSGGIEALIKGLEHNKTLTNLELRNNDLLQNYRHEDIQAIARLLKNNNTMESLNLDRCNLGDAGATVIGEALQHNKGLKYINLKDNGIRDRGIAAIAQGLELNDTLRSLDIESERFKYRDGSSTPNYMGVSGAKALRRLLEVNQTLSGINMNNSYGQNSWEISPVVAEIATGLRNNRTVCTFRLEDDFRPEKLYLSFNDTKIVAEAITASGNKNLSYYGYYRPNIDSLDSPDPEAIANLNKIHDYCEQNLNISNELLAKIREHPEELTRDDLQECQERMNAILYFAPSELEAEIPTILHRREDEIKRQTALQLRQETNDQVINDIRNYAEDNELTFEQICSDIALYRTDNFYGEYTEAFTRLINGDYSLRDIDTLLDLSNDKSQKPAMIALRQFVNHSLVPHLDYFLIQALKTEDLSQVNSGDYPHIAHLGSQPVLEAGITGFHAVVSTGYSKEIATNVEEETADLNLSFLGDREAGTLGERFSRASTLVVEQTQKFEEMFAGTRQKILEIITQRDEENATSYKKEQELEAAKKSNADIQERIGVIVREIEEKDRIAAARNESRVTWAFALGGLQIVAAGLLANPATAITGISTIIMAFTQNETDKKATSQERANLNSRIDHLDSRRISESSLEKQIGQIKQTVEELTRSEAYQKKYGSAQKMEAVRKAYLAKYVLDFGEQNLEEVYELCKESGIASVDEWIEQFDARLGTALTNFCFGSADSNDLSVILAEANALPSGDDDPARTVLRELAEEHIKRSIAEYYSHAAQVDKMYQANLIGLGTNLHEARAMVRRETDRHLVALIGYQHSTEPALMEGQYSARGARDISKVFAYWQHRHGDGVLDTSRLLDEHESPKLLPKRVTALPEREQRFFIERVKRTQAVGNADAPEIGDDFLRICAYEYMIPKFPDGIASGRRILSDNPQALAMYPVINATINNFIQSLGMDSLDHYRQHVGERLDNLIAQTFIDFFAELGTRHRKLQKMVDVGDELEEAKTRPELFARIFERYVRIVGKEANSRFDLFLEIYAHNLEKMLEVTRSDDRNVLLEQIDAVHELTEGKLKPNVVMPGSDEAKIKAQNENHTFENTGWNASSRV